MSGFTVQDVSGVRAHGGSKALRAVFTNDKGHITELSQKVAVVPGAAYSFSVWISNDNPTDYCNVILSGLPTVSTLAISNASVAFSAVAPAGSWYKLQMPFQTAASWATLRVRFLCNVQLPINSDAGKNTIYIDDALLVRTDDV